MIFSNLLKKASLPLAFWLALAAPALAADPSDARTAVNARFESLVRATRQGDFKAYLAHFDQERFTGMNADGSLWPNFASFRATAEPGFKAIKATLKLEFPEVNIIQIDKETVVLTNRYKHKLELDDGTVLDAKGSGTQVWSHRTGQWLLVSVSATAQ